MEESNFDKAYRDAFDLARQRLLGRDIAQCCSDAGAVLLERADQAAAVELVYLNTPVLITLPECTCSIAGQAEMHVWDRILLLHYLANEHSAIPAKREISFKQLKSASLYFSSFQNRCLRPLEKVFGSDTATLLERAVALGGERVEAGDCGVRLFALPLVPMTIVIWKGDEEFPASANILFDESIERHLSAEDIVVLSQRVVLKLMGRW